MSLGPQKECPYNTLDRYRINHDLMYGNRWLFVGDWKWVTILSSWSFNEVTANTGSTPSPPPPHTHNFQGIIYTTDLEGNIRRVARC